MTGFRGTFQHFPDQPIPTKISQLDQLIIPNRKKNTRNKSNKPAGGQKGHIGKTLQKIDDPDIVDVISVDRNHLPKGNYKEVGLKTRQVFDPNPHLESRNSAQVFRFSKCGLDLSIPFRILFFQSSFDHVHKNIKI